MAKFLSPTPPDPQTITKTIDNVRWAAKLLSEAIREANKIGVNVSIQANPADKTNLIQIIYSV